MQNKEQYGQVLRSGLFDIQSVREVNHNHPDGSDPSVADLRFASGYPNIPFNVYLSPQVQKNGINYLPFTNGEQLWLKLLYPNAF